MKPLLTLILVAFSLSVWAGADTDKEQERISRILNDASRQRLTAMTKADLEYRKAFANTLQLANRVEVFLLDFSMGKDVAYKPKDEDETFSIRPYNADTKVLKKRTVPAEDVVKWRTIVAKTISSNKDQSALFCHYPIHGIRIYAGEQLLFETSICWYYQNYYFNYDGTAHWEGFTVDSLELRKLVDGFMTIPESEQQRFSNAGKKGD